MKFKEVITEAPKEVLPTSFGLDDAVINKAFMKKHLPRVIEVIEQHPDFEIVRTGDNHRGWIFLHDKHRQMTDYVVKYETKNWAWLGQRTVTQCILWRNPFSQYARHITEHIFFDYLLPKYKAIMSDRLQTSMGHDFWQARMSDAAKRQLIIGIAYLNQHKVEWYDPTQNQDVESWVLSHDTYGKERKYEAIRYVIAQ